MGERIEKKSFPKGTILSTQRYNKNIWPLKCGLLSGCGACPAGSRARQGFTLPLLSRHRSCSAGGDAVEGTRGRPRTPARPAGGSARQPALLRDAASRGTAPGAQNSGRGAAALPSPPPRPGRLPHHCSRCRLPLSASLWSSVKQTSTSLSLSVFCSCSGCA